MTIPFLTSRCIGSENHLTVSTLIAIYFFYFAITSAHGMPPLNDSTIRTAAISYKWNRNDTTNYGPIEEWDTSQVTDMEYLFFHYSDINADLSRWDTSQVLNMHGMFEGTSNFNSDISQWDVSKVTSMMSMFSHAAEFNHDLSQWNVSKVENMRGMFAGAESFNGDVSRWNVSNVLFMHYMFSSAQSFNGVISQWDVTKVTNMDGMFYDAYSFEQELCWNVSSVSTIGIFESSPGVLEEYPACDYMSTSFTPRVTTVPRVTIPPTSTPSFTPIVTIPPTSTPSFTPRVTIPPKRMPITFPPTVKHTSVPTLQPVDTPTVAPSPRPTNKPTISSSRINLPINDPVSYVPPTASPTMGHADTGLSVVKGPILITSLLSTDSQKLCMRPMDMSLTEGSRIYITSCKEWNIFKWIVDYEGKFSSYKDPSMCIEMIGQKVSIQKCVDGLVSQKWIYSSNGRRILSIKNLRKEIAILDEGISQGAVVKSITLMSGKSSEFEMWEIHYDSMRTISVPSYDTFRIVSHLSTEHDKWCLYPANNSPINGAKIAISKCKMWNTYKWIMDYEGKIFSVKALNKCITRLQNRIIIDDCEDGNKSQIWIYSVLDQKLVSMKNGMLQATVKSGSRSKNSQVKLCRSKSPGSPHQTWEIEEI